MKPIHVAIIALISLLAACSSNPDIPDEADKVDYRSTQLEDGEKTAGQKEESGDAAPSASEAVSAPEAIGPIATVNGTEIPAREFNTEIQRVMASGMPLALATRYRDTIVQKLVDRHLIDSAIAKEDFEITDAEIDEKLEEVKAEFAASMQGSGQDVSLQALVQQLGIDESELRDSVKQSIAIEKMLQKRGMETPTEKEVREFYDANIEEKFTLPEQVRVRHILVSVPAGSDEAAVQEAKARAEKLRDEARKEGVDFAELAEEKSEGPSASQGGDLGFVPRGKTVPEFENAAFGLEKGEISEPVKSPYGWHVIKLVEKKDPEVVDFEEISERLAMQLKGQRIKASLDEYLTELREKAEITIHTENLK